MGKSGPHSKRTSLGRLPFLIAIIIVGATPAVISSSFSSSSLSDLESELEDMNVQGAFGQVLPVGTDIPLFGQSDNGGDTSNSVDSNSESASETVMPPSQREQSEDGENTFGSEVGSTEGTPTVNIDPASSDSLSVLSHRISTDEILDDPTMDINGEIQNNGTESLDFVKATATFYDAANSILGSDFGYTDPTTLEPGQTAPFEITAGFGNDIPVDEISRIKLHISGR